MMQQRLANVLGRLRRATLAPAGDGPTDGELLGRFVQGRDQAAFELLVWRHGAMVYATCLRQLSSAHDAEDAFQATFLALVRQAASIGKREAIAGWLHAVACRTARKLRLQATRRLERDREVAAQVRAADSGSLDDGGLTPALWAEVRQTLDDEINRLPAKLRVPFLLCNLQGLTNEEAARQLGCPKGTVQSRLARARERLRGRLVQRGLTLSVGALLIGLSQEVAAAAPALLVQSTIKSALLIAAGQATTGVVAGSVAALTEGVVHAMFMTKVKTTFAVILGIGLLGAGTGGIMYQSSAAGQGPGQLEPAVAAQSTQKSKPASTTDERQALSRAELDAARARLEEAKALALSAEVKVRQLQAQLEAMQAEMEVARANYERLLKLGTAPAPATKEQPRKVTPRPVTTPAPTPVLALGAASPSDLIQLGTAYADALRDVEIAKVRSAAFRLPQASPEEREIAVINLSSAERKLKLLHAIIEGSVQGAEVELRYAQDQHRAGIGPVSSVLAAESKLRMLKLVLGSVK